MAQEPGIEDIRPGLARWVTPHPEWKPEEDYLDESYRDVASVLHVAPDALVLVDPLVPHSLWPNLDARIEAAGKPVVVLTTIHATLPETKIRRFTVRDVPGARGWTGSDLHGNPIGTVHWVQGRCMLLLVSEGDLPFVEVLSTGARAIYERTGGECP